MREGRVVAVKGLGGFHLVCDAANARAVALLRQRKPRMEKPFAIMVRDLDQARAVCEVSDEAARLLASAEAPILVLPRRPDSGLAANVAPGYPTLGVMLPYTPLHELLLRAIQVPVVATSGNLSDEPIATDNDEARERLGTIAELFLVHDRPIERHVDDSVGWLVGGSLALLRRARGYAPLPVRVAREWPTVLAVGGHLKSTIALALGSQVFLSQHIGDLETPEAMSAFERVIDDFLRLYEAKPVAIAHDLHPDYVSTQWAKRVAGGAPEASFAVREGAAEAESPGGSAAPYARSVESPPPHSGDGAGAASDARPFPWGGPPCLIAVQHHHAHLAACLAEHGVAGPALGVTWDGTGCGIDGTVWGGEFLLGDAASYRRVAHLRPFRLPGG